MKPAPLFLLPPRGHRARKLALILLGIAPFLFGLLALYLGQDANWDLRNYHWYNAYAFLNNRYDLDLLPSQTPFFYNPTLDVPFYLLATHVPARAAGFLLGCVQGLNFILLFMLAHAALVIPNARQKVLGCAGLAALGMLGGGGIALIGTTFYDNVTSLGLFASALLVIRARNKFFASSWPRALGTAAFCGLPCGLMMGLKLPCVVFCVGLCFALFCVAGPLQRRVWIAFGFGLGVVLGAAVTLGHWMAFLDAHYGSPLFPYYNAVFKSPLYPIENMRDTEYLQRSWHDNIFFPFIFGASSFRTGEIDFRDWRIPILYALLPLAVILRLCFGRAKKQQDAATDSFVTRYLLWVASIAYFCWLAMFCIYRYLIPLEMLAPLLIVLAIALLPVKPRTRALIAAFALLVVACSVQPGNWTRRAAWLDRFVEADMPAIDTSANPMILMAGEEPYAHMAAFLPPQLPVIRIQSNFAAPEQTIGINTLIRQRVDAHNGAFLLFLPPWQLKGAAAPLAAYDLRLSGKPCQKAVDRLYQDTELDLCPVERIQPRIP